MIDKLAWLSIEDKKILVTRSKGKQTWYIPGGKRETGENDAEALIREIKEELSVSLLPETIAYFGAFEAPADGKAADIRVKMSCYFANHVGDLRVDNEIEELAWFDMAGIDNVSAVDILIFEALAKRGLLDMGFPRPNRKK